MEETTSKKKKPRLLYKREPDADDTYNALGGRAESSSSEDEGDGEELQLISKKLAKKFKFPPGCRVIFYEYEDSAAAGSLEVARMIKGVVSQIFVNAIQRDQPPSYEISFLPEPGQAATSLARKKETELRFAFKTPVWLSVDSEENNSEQQEAAVVGFEDVGSTVAYSVQLCYGDRRVYHGVQLGGRLKYRFEVTERKIEEEDHNQEYLESHVKDESKEDVPVPESGSDRSDQEKEKMPEETKNRTGKCKGYSYL